MSSCDVQGTKRGKVAAAMSLQSLEFAHRHLHCIFLGQASHKARPDSAWQMMTH